MFRLFVSAPPTVPYSMFPCERKGVVFFFFFSREKLHPDIKHRAASVKSPFLSVSLAFFLLRSNGAASE